MYVTVGYELGRGIKYAYLDPVWVGLTFHVYYVVGKEESYLVGLDEVERFKLGVYNDSA